MLTVLRVLKVLLLTVTNCVLVSASEIGSGAEMVPGLLVRAAKVA